MLTVEVAGQEMTLDPDSLTLADRWSMRQAIADMVIVDKAGRVVEPDDADRFACLLWVLARREATDLTLHAVLAGLRVNDVKG